LTWHLNELPIISARMEHPAVENWSCTCQVISDAAPTGAAVLTLPGLTLQGTVLDSGLTSQRVTVRLCGGAGKLATRIPGQHFAGAQGRLVAQSILQAAGEVLDPASDAPGLDTVLPHWTYFAGPAGVPLAQLCTRLGCVWWMTAEGMVHLGVLVFPEAAPAAALLQDVRADLKRLSVALEDETIQPRTTYEGRKVLTVDHTLTPDFWRARVRYQ
jgi:hypothetical protein